VNQATLSKIAGAIKGVSTPVTWGRVVDASGLVIRCFLPEARVGDIVEIAREGAPLLAEIVAFQGADAVVMPFQGTTGIAPGTRVRRHGAAMGIPASPAVLGRVLDPFGRALDGGPSLPTGDTSPVDADPPAVGLRAPIRDRFDTGVRVIDGLLTCGRGQRVGIFAGAGVGKTVLIRQILMQSKADVAVIGLIGERGVEVADLLSNGVAPHAAMVVATSDRSPLERARGAMAATTLAEHFRDQGKHVLLILDSLTRYAMALREIGLSAGEPPATKGYPPSVFASMPRLLERVAPIRGGGSITAFYTVLVEGDDLSDPVADSARSLLDGHIVLSRELAGRGHFPAVDVLQSASRVSRNVTQPAQRELADKARGALAARRDVEELRSLGAYQPGQNKQQDEALATGVRLDGWMRQKEEGTPYDETIAGLDRALTGKKS
jgi:flagellum-specific ATP synthase